MARPTEKQQRLIKGWGLTVPPSKAAATKLIGYIFKGNRTGGISEADRIERARVSEKRWLGKKVEKARQGEVQEGRVLYLRYLNSQEIYNQEELLKESGVTDAKLAPFELWVKWPDGKAKSCVSQVKLVGD